MTKTRKINRARSAFAVAAVAVLGLSACGSDKSVTQVPRIAAEYTKSIGVAIKGKLGGKTPQAAPAPKLDHQALINAALKATPGPIAFVTRKSGAIAAMSPVQSNAGADTWMSAGKLAIVFKDGMIIGTRGFGDDLMASDLGRARSAIKARGQARYSRTYEHLNGLGQTTRFKAQCDLSVEKHMRVAVGEIDRNTTLMKEQCRYSGGLSFDNRYWVDAAGRIVQSHQWISQGAGHLLVQPLR
ncbi:YjbF family lipoprotein [Aliiroseovarius crassostreae]|uniref:YjbF family lipoprotein n=1 Tax=Aliiroseovarius crassostreae TaxID=154981 RepID=UPI0021F96F6D|nr:YjbF family lipoprotein [Aliiroseovarius crassostreae]UWQ01870.1 YjbF family lipoprotein [Aliiroseovarius crassostreae]